MAEGAVRGNIDEVASAGGQTTVVGWATDAAAKQVAEWVLAFAGKRLVAVTRPNQLRSDLGEAFGQSVITAGFRLVVTGTQASRAPLRIFAISDGMASEIESGAAG